MNNRQCSFGQTNNPLENIIQKQQVLNNNMQQFSHIQMKLEQQSQNSHENTLNFNKIGGNSFQKSFNEDWNKTTSGNRFVQKNSFVIQEDQEQSIHSQSRTLPSFKDQSQLQQQNIQINSNQDGIFISNQGVEFQKLKVTDQKRTQTEESNNDSFIYKGEEIDKILSRYSFQTPIENNDQGKFPDFNIQNMPVSLSYSINNQRICSENNQFYSPHVGDQDFSINFNLKQPLNSYSQSQNSNEQGNLQNTNSSCNKITNIQEHPHLNYLNNNNNIISSSSQNNLTKFVSASNTQISNIDICGNSIRTQENLNLNKNNLSCNHPSAIKQSLVSQVSSTINFPKSNNNTSNCIINSQKLLPSQNMLPSSNYSNKDQNLQIELSQTKQKNVIQTQNDELITNFNSENNNNSKINNSSKTCQQCTLNHQQMIFLQIQLNESQEREETQKKLNDTLMTALNSVNDDMSEQKSKGNLSKNELLRKTYEEEINQLREQMKTRQKQQELVSKELVKKFDEIEEQKQSLELQVQDLKSSIDSKNKEINEIICNSSKKDYQIFKLKEDITKLQNLTLSFDQNQVLNLQRKIEQMLKNHEYEIQQRVIDSQNESQKLNTLLTKTIEQFENKIRNLEEEKNLIEKSSISNTEKCNELFQKFNSEIVKLTYQKDEALKKLENSQKTIDQQKIQATAQSVLLSQIQEQERTIEYLQGNSLAHESLQIQFAQQTANIKHQQLKINQLQLEYQELKAKRENDIKNAAAKYAELASKLTEHQQMHQKMKKDFERKSAMIIREILNKDMKVKQLQTKQQLQNNSSSPFNNSNTSNLLLGSNNRRSKSPLSHLLHDDRILSDHPNFVEFNKSQLLYSPSRIENTRSNTPKNIKCSPISENDKGIDILQSKSKSPLNKGTQNTQQFWQNFMDMSNMSSDNLLTGFQNLHVTIGDEEEENIANGNYGQIMNLTQDDLKNKYQALLHSRNVLEVTINDLKLQLNRKNEQEVYLKNEIKFIVEYLVQNLADQAVLDIKEKENQNPFGISTSNISILNDQSKTRYLNEDDIMRETDKILKQHIIKLQQKAIQSQMIECNNIVTSILGQNLSDQKQKQSETEKQPLMQSEKQKSLNKIQSQLSLQVQQDQFSSSSNQKIKKQQNTTKLFFTNKTPSANSQSVLLSNQHVISLNEIINPSLSNRQLNNPKAILSNKNDTSLNASNLSNNSPSKFKKPVLKLSDLKVDTKQVKKNLQKSPSPLSKQPQLTPTKSQKIQKFGYFLSKQSNLNNTLQKSKNIKSSENNLSQNLSYCHTNNDHSYL